MFQSDGFPASEQMPSAPSAHSIGARLGELVAAGRHFTRAETSGVFAQVAGVQDSGSAFGTILDEPVRWTFCPEPDRSIRNPRKAADRASPAMRSFPLPRCGVPLSRSTSGKTNRLARKFLRAFAGLRMTTDMYESFATQLAGLNLSGFSITPAPFYESDFPCEDDMAHTLGAVWSDLFALFADTALEADGEDLATGFVNLFNRVASRKSAQVDQALDETRALLASADGAKVLWSNLEEKTLRAQSAEANILAFEHMRGVAADLYRDETGSRGVGSR